VRIAGLARAMLISGAVAAALAGCSAPSLTLYSLAGPTAASDPPRPSPLGSKPTVIEIARVTVPDEIDTEDIFVRDGSMLRRSAKGRLASRLSLGATDRITLRLGERKPDALVTDRQQVESPAYRILINISRFDITTAGVGTLEADWLIQPHDPTKQTHRDRARFVVKGPVATDQDVVKLQEKLLDRLADAINIKALPEIGAPEDRGTNHRRSRHHSTRSDAASLISTVRLFPVRPVRPADS
jgi:uncharacterized protein